MTIEVVTIFQCTECKKTFNYDIGRCPCENVVRKGTVQGPFRIVEKTPDKKWHVICLLCNVESVIQSSNIKKQKSCGCKPRYITIRMITEEEVRYTCTRCGKTTVEELPILEWCCEGE